VLLDLFCGAGGCSWGYYLGGFRNVWGVDNEPIRNYVDKDKFLQGDALNVLDTLELGGTLADAIKGAPAYGLEHIDAIHASPPCQGYSVTKRFNPDKEYPKLIERVRESLERIGKPYIIENVEAAPLYARVILCGAMFPEAGLKTYRHRQFETNFPVAQPIHPPHLIKTAKMGRPPLDGEFMHVVGNFPRAQYARDAMGIQWMNREELAESIPPAYTQYISKYLWEEIYRREN
jgi:DNA (cytosine-5)-methyltransferase 1